MGKIKQALIFSLKVWLTTIILFPLVLFVAAYFSNGCKSCNFRQYYLSVGGEFVAFLLLLPLIFAIVLKGRKNAYSAKKQRQAILIAGVFFTIWYSLIVEILLYGYRSQRIDAYSLLYILIFPALTGLGLWFYKLKPEKV